MVLNDNNTINPNNIGGNNMKNYKIFEAIMWIFCVITMPVLAIPSLIGALISKKLIKKYFGITDDMDEV
jgi:hypothetical protein